MKPQRWFRPSLIGIVFLAAVFCQLHAQAPPRRHLLIVVDGLRPDYVTTDVMPNLSAIGRRGVIFRNHHSVFPTVTRVNASSIATGTYPERHGLMGNTVYFPKVDPTKFLDTAERKNLVAIAEREGRLLTTTTLGELLQKSGRRMLVVSSGSSGSAFLNNPTVAGGAILHYEYTLPADMQPAMTAALGPPPRPDSPMGTLDTYAVNALLKVGLPKIDPSVTVIWLSDLDSTAHDHGVGHPATVATLKHVDGEIKRIEDGLKAAGLFDRYDIWITSDHGFSTHTGAVDIDAVLKPFQRTLPDGSPRIVTSGGAIYVRDDDTATVSAIVTVLQRTRGIGAIFTRGAHAGSFDGRVPGTLSFEAAHWDHARSAQILYSPDWTDAENAYGMRGSVASSGTAGHGSSSPWDVHNTLIAAGPDLKAGTTVDLPSANVDFAPTFLHLLGLPVPSSMQGRILTETNASVRKTQITSDRRDVNYSVTATFSIVTANGRDYRYFDGTKVVRK